jgi:hypothetical protein
MDYSVDAINRLVHYAAIDVSTNHSTYYYITEILRRRAYVVKILTS